MLLCGNEKQVRDKAEKNDYRRPKFAQQLFKEGDRAQDQQKHVHDEIIARITR